MSAKSKRLLACASVALAVPALTMGAAVPSASAQSKIVGGTAVPDGKYTFMASLKSRWGSHFCGGTLIKSNWVLTASHCVAGKNAKSMSVVVGSARLSSGGYASKITKIVMHPSYGKPVRYAHDAALLQLTTPVTAVAPIAVDSNSSPTNPLEAPGHSLTTTGWGTTSEGGSCCPDRMNEVDVPVVSDASCQTSYGAASFDAASMLCAGTGGKDSCQGDSGGPLFDKTSLVQLGTVSWGNGCARAGYPGVYGELNYPTIRNWITTTAGV